MNNICIFLICFLVISCTSRNEEFNELSIALDTQFEELYFDYENRIDELSGLEHEKQKIFKELIYMLDSLDSELSSESENYVIFEKRKLLIDSKEGVLNLGENEIKVKEFELKSPLIKRVNNLVLSYENLNQSIYGFPRYEMMLIDINEGKLLVDWLVAKFMDKQVTEIRTELKIMKILMVASFINSTIPTITETK